MNARIDFCGGCIARKHETSDGMSVTAPVLVCKVILSKQNKTKWFVHEELNMMNYKCIKLMKY